MSSQEEEKVVQSDPCTKCYKSINFTDEFSFHVELTWGNEVCFKCIIKELPEEEGDYFSRFGHSLKYQT